AVLCHRLCPRAEELRERRACTCVQATLCVGWLVGLEEDCCCQRGSLRRSQVVFKTHRHWLYHYTNLQPQGQLLLVLCCLSGTQTHGGEERLASWHLGQ